MVNHNNKWQMFKMIVTKRLILVFSQLFSFCLFSQYLKGVTKSIESLFHISIIFLDWIMKPFIISYGGRGPKLVNGLHFHWIFKINFAFKLFVWISAYKVNTKKALRTINHFYREGTEIPKQKIALSAVSVSTKVLEKNQFRLIF